MLIETQSLPEPYCHVFDKYLFFNHVQTAAFEDVFQSVDNNVVISAPTASGKTCLFELAICRLMHNNPGLGCKALYMAPTKALCAERVKDWQSKFQTLGLRCGELTGDTTVSDLPIVKESDIIVTTPEKWDSISRRWRDSRKLVQMIRLFLIDEVHMLKERRGAILEVVVSRMKQVGSNLRFLALSATVPNIDDVARWLKLSSAQEDWPARSLSFGEEFRPVQLQRFVYGYPKSERMNDFAFDATLTKQWVHGIIAKHGKGKPVIVFCSTRKDALKCAKELVSTGDLTWQPSLAIPWKFHDKDLNELASAGVAFHHAGLETADRTAVERAFLQGDILIITATSTLAVGVNLPAHLVVLKNTLTYAGGTFEEYSDLEVLQMIGRAGRPQFDDLGVAVIMTEQSKVENYENLVSGTEILESSLHANLLEHINAEISLGTFNNIAGAINWLKSTFLYVRIKQNPTYYSIDSNDSSIDETLQDLCKQNIESLARSILIRTTDERLSITPFGDAMAKYYVRYGTMRLLLALPPQANCHSILIAICKAEELGQHRFRAGEKPFYNELKKDKALRFTYTERTTDIWQKIMLMAQLDICCIDLEKWKDKYKDALSNISIHKASIRLQLLRLLACMIDCKLESKDSISVRNGLELRRSIAAKCWYNHPSMLKQLNGIGDGSLKTLLNAGISSFESLRITDPRKLERIFRRNPPFGNVILQDLASFPELDLQVRLDTCKIVAKSVELVCRVEINCMNNPRSKKGNLQHHVIFLVDTPDGQLLEFRRHSIHKIVGTLDVRLQIHLLTFTDKICFSIMCEEIVGSIAELTLALPLQVSDFPQQNVQSCAAHERSDLDDIMMHCAVPSSDYLDIFDDEVAANPEGKTTVRDRPLPMETMTDRLPIKTVKTAACSHFCKDKQRCAHVCCKIGRKNTNACSVKYVPLAPGHVQGELDTKNCTQLHESLDLDAPANSSVVDHLNVIDLTEQSIDKPIHDRKLTLIDNDSGKSLAAKDIEHTASQTYDLPCMTLGSPSDSSSATTSILTQQNEDEYGWSQDLDYLEVDIGKGITTSHCHAQEARLPSKSSTEDLFMPTSPSTPDHQPPKRPKLSPCARTGFPAKPTIIPTLSRPSKIDFRSIKSSLRKPMAYPESAPQNQTLDDPGEQAGRTIALSPESKLLDILGDCFIIVDEEAKGEKSVEKPAEQQSSYRMCESKSRDPDPMPAMADPAMSLPRMLRATSTATDVHTKTAADSVSCAATITQDCKRSFAQLFRSAEW